MALDLLIGDDDDTGSNDDLIVGVMSFSFSVWFSGGRSRVIFLLVMEFRLLSSMVLLVLTDVFCTRVFDSFLVLRKRVASFRIRDIVK